MFKSNGSLGYSYRTQRYRYTQWVSNKSGKITATELYDYETDPLETKNLTEDPSYTEICQRLAGQMLTDAQGCKKLLASGKNDQ